VKVDYWPSNTRPETLLEEFARVAEAKHRIEQCLQLSKREAGLAYYEMRNGTGWQHHQTLSLLATWFLVRETQREKNESLQSPLLSQQFDAPHRRSIAKLERVVL